MIAITFRPTATTRRFTRTRLRVQFWLANVCAAYHESRVTQAQAGIRYARNNGTLPLYDGYFQETINESADWIKWAHETMALIKSDLMELEG